MSNGHRTKKRGNRGALKSVNTEPAWKSWGTIRKKRGSGSRREKVTMSQQPRKSDDMLGQVTIFIPSACFLEMDPGEFVHIHVNPEDSGEFILEPTDDENGLKISGRHSASRPQVQFTPEDGEQNFLDFSDLGTVVCSYKLMDGVLRINMPEFGDE